MPLLNPSLGIDFSDYIADRTHNFTGREWVFEAIQNWLADSNGERFFLLTGEPGSGKTAIAARLAQFAQGVETYSGLEAGFLQAVHFCSARDSVWTDPKEFARSLALQLAQSIPEFGLALKDVGEKTNNINVDLSIGTAQNSEITGVVIQNLTLSGLTGQEAFTQVVVNPLRQIQQEGVNQPLTILVDSLDEALTHDGESTIVSLLSKLSTSIKLRLILTSRNEGRVKDKLNEYEELFISAEENLDKNQQDIRSYIDTKFQQEETLQSTLQTKALDQETLITSLIEKSEGNFLYVRFLLESVALGQQSFASLDGLPQGLDELYYNSLGRVIELGKKNWSEIYAPVMGVLLAAQESLTESQIRAFTKLKESVVWDCLNDLQQFLDEIEAEDEETQYKLYHQSVTDFLGKRQLVIRKKKSNNRYYLPEQEQHQRLLEYYRPEGKSWNEVQLEQIDSYGQRHLAQHLVKGDRVDELHLLLSLEKDGRNAWFKLKDSEGETASFLADVELAWAQADEAYESDPGKSIGLQCRYALIKASINSLAGIPRELLVTLVKHRYWKTSKAFAYARQISNPQARAINLTALAKYLPNTEPLKFQILQAALQSVRAIQEDSDRAQALTELGDELTPELLPQALEVVSSIRTSGYDRKALQGIVNQLTPDLIPRALEIALASEHTSSRLEALTALANKFPDLIPQALEVAQAIPYDTDRLRLLTALADKFPPQLLPQALEIAVAIQREEDRAEALIALANNLTPELLPQALEAVQCIQDEAERTKALIALAGNSPSVLLQALEVARTLQNDDQRTRILVALANKLPPDLLPQALEVAQATQRGDYLSNILVALAANLTPDLLPQALEIAKVLIKDDNNKSFGYSYGSSVLKALANQLTSDLLPKFLETVRAMESAIDRGISLEALANKLMPELLPEVLEAAQAIQDDRYRVKVLTALADKLPTVLPKALEAAQAIPYNASTSDWTKPTALIELIDKLTPDFLPQVLETAQTLQDRSHRISVLTALADKFPEICPIAVETAQIINDDCYCAKALAILTTKTPRLLPLTLRATRAIQVRGSWFSSSEVWCTPGEVLDLLVDQLTPDHLSEFLEIAAIFQDNSAAARALVKLVHTLPSSTLTKFLEIAQVIQDDYSRAVALTALAAKLPDAVPKALEVIQNIFSQSERAELLIALANKLTPHLLPQALEVAGSIAYDHDYAEVLFALADQLILEMFPQFMEAAFRIVDSHARLRVLRGLVDKLTPEQLPQALEAIRAIQDGYFGEFHRAEIWTVLADKFPSFLPQAIETAQTIKDEYCRVAALIVLADKLPEGFLQVWQVVQAIQDEYTRADLLSALLDKVTLDLFPQVLSSVSFQSALDRNKVLSAVLDKLNKLPEVPPEALEAAQTVKDELERAEMLVVLAGKLTPDLLPQILEAAQAIQDDSGRCKVLTAIADKYSEVLPQALEAAQAIHFMGDRVEALITLAGKLTPDLLPQILETAQAIQDGSDRSRVLSAIADKLPEVLLQHLEATQVIQDEYRRVNLLPILTFLLTKIPHFALWKKILHYLSYRTRPSLLGDIQSLIPVLDTLGGEAGIIGTAGAIQDVSRWWT